LAPWLVVAGILGGRALYAIMYWERDFAGHPWSDVVAVWQGGLVYYGGLILATLVGIWRIRVMDLPLWSVADCLAPGIALGHAFGRIGCLMNGCCYGQPTTLAWGIQFPMAHSTYPSALHPTQIYESLLNLVFFAVLMWAFRRRRFSGQIFAIYLMGYAVLRSFTELFRGDYESRAESALALTPGQSTSLLILAAGIALFFLLRPRSAELGTMRR
jgi:phosphatidylglycerol:prolipoprotein diacylglycerol transferase